MTVERALSRAWFDEQDRMTPEELRTVVFPQTRMGRRGFEEEPVRQFLHKVHAEFVRLVTERASLWQEVERLRKRLATGNGDGHPPAGFGEPDAHVHAVRILSAAQLTADRYVADAQAYSSRLTEEARLRRDQIMREAEQHADMILEEAHVTARDAAVSALNLPAPTPADVGQTGVEWQAAQAELAYLRTYSEVYRAHLRAYTEGVLRGIEEWERNEAASFTEVANGLPVHRANGHG